VIKARGNSFLIRVAGTTLSKKVPLGPAEP